MYIPNSGELVASAALIGACVGFLVQCIPGTGVHGRYGKSGHYGGIIASLAIIIRKLLIPILCGIFLMENLSVMMQVSYFKITQTKVWRRQAHLPHVALHHHYQKSGMHGPRS